ncbi:MAG: glycosyltransferase [Planctomycetaceae bacterium]|nr:glycosyltransferase [Planctomycetaceae bacterium]
MTRVSTIIPAYNAEAFLRETLDSALAQTHDEQEIIVVDDGSTDATCEIAESFGNRVKLIRQQNAGPAAARNRGAREASGEWLAFLDADDLWMPDKISTQLERANETGAPLIYTDRENIGVCDHVSRYQSDCVELAEGELYEKLLCGNFITLSSVLIRKDVFESEGGFNEDLSLKAVEDWEFWLRIASSHAVAVCPEPLVQYRFHETGISRNLNTMETNLFNALDVAFDSKRGQQLDATTRRKARASAWGVLGWSAASTNPRSAVRYFTRAWLNDPCNLWRVKQVVKSALGRA